MPRRLLDVPTTVTGARLTVDDGDDGVRTLALNGHCQSDIKVLKGGVLDEAQPLELVQVMSVLSLAWINERQVTAPRVLLLGLGGGSIARVLSATLPTDGSIHSVELEPEVIQAAVDFFGLQLREGRCTAEAGDCAAFLRNLHSQCQNGGGDDANYDVIILGTIAWAGLSGPRRP